MTATRFAAWQLDGIQGPVANGQIWVGNASSQATATGGANGQLFIGNGSGFSLNTLQGTSNQISVTNGAGNITLSTPQNIDTSATPQFGNLGIGAQANSYTGINCRPTTTGNATHYGIDFRPVFDNTCTSSAAALSLFPSTSAASFTLPILRGLLVNTITAGSGSTVTAFEAISVFPQTVGSSTNYGIRSQVASSANGAYNLYIDGTAPNYFAGTTTFAKHVYFPRTTLTYASSLSWDVSSNQVAVLTLTGNSTITPTNMASGTTYLLFLKQDSTGSRTVTWVNCKWPGGTAPTLSTAANSVDIASFVSDGTYLYGNVNKGYA